MAGRVIDLDDWGRAEKFRFFRAFDRPHFATTARIDATHLMARRRIDDLSPFRAVIWAIGAACDAVPELRLRFAGDTVTLHDAVQLSFTVPMPDGDFRYGYVPWQADFAAFDRDCAARIAAVATRKALNANRDGRDDLVYLSCLPWLDYTALDNAMPGPRDCIPRIGWGRIVAKQGGHDMAMSIQVHHALVDGRPVGRFYEEVQSALDGL